MFSRVVPGCAVLALLLPLDVAASQPAADTSPLVAELSRAIQSHHQFGIFDDVVVDVEGDAAVLTGRVTSPEKKAGFGIRAAEVPGVRSVRNDIKVLPASAEDDELRYRIARAVYGHPAFWSRAAMPNPPIHVVVESGHVTLTGTVNSNAERALARSLAGSFGERSLANHLRVRGECRVSRC
ncbi:hypothetical protein BH23ACI1_BH23ACI1_06800 [soil metagenome]